MAVGHFDHGLLADSAKTARFVAGLAKKYQVEFISQRAQLPDDSEATARTARYLFLQKAQQDLKAEAIITGHHLDDLIETMVLNLVRKTGRLGLTSLRSRPQLQRPLLANPKAKIEAYAKQKGLEFKSDPSNQDQRYRRNFYRQQLTGLDSSQKEKLYQYYQQLVQLNDNIDFSLASYLRRISYRQQNLVFPRSWFNRLETDFATEIVHTWLRFRTGGYGRRRQVIYLVDQLKHLSPGKKISLTTGQFILLSKRSIRLPAESDSLKDSLFFKNFL